MIKATFALLLAVLAANASGAESHISSLAIGVVRPDERAVLAPSFINAVNRYLARYEPKLVERSANYVKMIVDYDFDYAVELKVKDQEYEITVTLAEKTSRLSKAQKQAAKLVTGVHRTLEDYLVREARARR